MLLYFIAKMVWHGCRAVELKAQLQVHDLHNLEVKVAAKLERLGRSSGSGASRDQRDAVDIAKARFTPKGASFSMI